MKTLIPITNQKLTKLQSHDFFIWSNRQQASFEDKLSFVPVMNFFILGLNDIYGEFSSLESDDFGEKSLIDYCKLNINAADKYLEDLELLGFTASSWGGPLSEIFKKTWSEENYFSRKYIYQIHHYIQHNTIEENIFTLGLVHDQFFLLMNAIANISNEQSLTTNLNFFNFKDQAIWPKGHLNVDELIGSSLPGQSYYRCYEILDKLHNYFISILDQWLSQKDIFKRNLLLANSHFINTKADIKGIFH